VKSWPVQDAKARFSEMLETCVREGPQLVTARHRCCRSTPLEQWQKLKRAAKPTLKELLLANGGRGELSVPERGGKRRRKPLV
jgi:hypothetical protein